MSDSFKNFSELVQRLDQRYQPRGTTAIAVSGTAGPLPPHVLADNTIHTATGLSVGQVIRASGAASFAWAQLQHSDLGSVSADQHHAQSHVIATTAGLGDDHSTSGLTAGQVLRASGATTAAFAAIQDADLPATIVRTSRTLTAGAGLTGGGDLSADRTFDVGAGTLITVAADSVGITPGSAQYQYIVSGATPFTAAWSSGYLNIAATKTLTVELDSLVNQDLTSDASPTFTTVKCSNLTDGYVPYHVADATGLANSPIYTDGTSIGIGTTNPGAKLEVSGTAGANNPEIAITGPVSGTPILTLHSAAGGVLPIIGYNSDGGLRVGTVTGVGAAGFSEKVRIDSSGNVGFATPTPRKLADFLSTTQAQLRLTYTDNSVYTDFTVNSSGILTIAPTGNIIKFPSAVRIQSDNYVSQTTGWGISYAGSADFRYLYADEMHVKAFIADLEQALAGGQIISKSVAPLAADFTVPAAGAAASLVVESFKGFDTFQVFVDGDFVRLRQFDRTGTSLSITNCWGTVVWVSTDTTAKTQTYTFTRSAAPNAGAAIAGSTIGAGTLALDYGTTGNGFLESNAIDGAMAEYAPYHQIVSWTTHPNSGLTVRTRLGNLKGIFNVANEYGLYAGAGVTDADQYLRISNTAVEAHNLPIKMYDGASVTMQMDPTAPSLAMGSTLPSAYGTGDGLWMGKDTLYKFRVGDVDGELIKWDGSDLYIMSDATNYVKFTGNDILMYSNNVNVITLDGATSTVTVGVTSSEHISISSTAVQIKDGATVYTELAAGSLTIGEVGASKSNVLITAGKVQVRNNTTDIVVFDTTESRIDNLLKMSGASAAIAIGSTPPTSASAGTGGWLDRTGLYGLASNVVQAKMDFTTGKIVAGAGKITLDATAIHLTTGEVNASEKQAGSYIEWTNTASSSYSIETDHWNNGVVTYDWFKFYMPYNSGLSSYRFGFNGDSGLVRILGGGSIYGDGQLTMAGVGTHYVMGPFGIGTTGPGAELEVKSTTSSSEIYTTYSTTAQAELTAGSDGNVYIGSRVSGSNVYFRTGAASTAVTILSGGNVVIGGTAAVGLLHVSGGQTTLTGSGTTGATYSLVCRNSTPTTTAYVDNAGNGYIFGNFSADSFTDRTPFFVGNALDAIANVKHKDGKLDHDSLHEFMRYHRKLDDGTMVTERNIGNTVSVLLVAIQELQAEIERLKKN